MFSVFSAIFYKGPIFVTPMGSKLFPVRVGPLSKGDSLAVIFPKSVSSSFNLTRDIYPSISKGLLNTHLRTVSIAVKNRIAIRKA